MSRVEETWTRSDAEMTFPDVVTADIRVARLGNSSVRYEIGLFRNDEETVAAEDFFVHVNVDHLARRPVHFGHVARRVLEPLLGSDVFHNRQGGLLGKEARELAERFASAAKDIKGLL
ncbi:acyl-CoA thioesterase [Sinorhizobium prairiense]|uniref:acyl-CoA thioesterase n=1 Tax=unclassified Sinorhizobium TaxID=2613772 RepID=UPI0035C8944E